MSKVLLLTALFTFGLRGGPVDCLKFSSSAIPNEYLVIFRHHALLDAQHAILNEALQQDNWSPVAGRRPFTSINDPSDVITIQLKSAALRDMLLLHPQIKYVVPERRIFVKSTEADIVETRRKLRRSLHSIPDNYDAQKLWEIGYAGQKVIMSSCTAAGH